MNKVRAKKTTQFVWTDKAKMTANAVYLIAALPASTERRAFDRHSLSEETGVPADVIMSDDPYELKPFTL